MDDLIEMKRTHHRVLIQNADGNINMGLFFNDRDIEMSDIYWFNCIAFDIECSIINNDGLVMIDEESKTKSCYVELHRIGTLKIFTVLLKKNYYFEYIRKSSSWN